MLSPAAVIHAIDCDMGDDCICIQMLPKAPRIRDEYVLHLFRLQHLGEPCEACELRPGVDPHHRIYRSQGGGDVAENLMWLCRPCHDDVHNGRLKL